jgi:RNA polymerase sigma factor (sigma-70 family)
VKIKKSAVGTPQTWSIADLGAFYTEHSFELKTHAIRILKDSTRADEVVQDAFIKVMLAAPELTSADHALSYLHRTIENICIDLFRAEGRRPHLVVLDDAQAEVEAQWQASGDHSQQISAAEDAAIIRQALALLSPAERTALVMWEMDGRTTAEIAAELGIKESAVRHTVSRARASLRKVLSTLIIDEERGLTALDLLSTSYKKAAELAHKSSRAALSLILVVAAFLGFHTMTGSEPKVLTPSVSTTTELQIPTTPVKPVVKSKSVLKRSLPNQTNIQDLTNQLDFAKVELSAQVDLLNVIMDTNVFGTDAKSAAPVQLAAINAVEGNN